MVTYPGLLQILYDFQTLITGAAALIAASMATAYSRRQMKLSTREMLIARGKALAQRRSKTSALTNDIRDMQRHLNPWEEETVEPSSEWAHSAEKTADLIAAALREHQDTSLDGLMIERRRKDLIDVCGTLASCLYDIHALQSVDFGGFEEPPISARQEYEQRAAAATQKLGGILLDGMTFAKALDDAFTFRLAEIRRELRELERFALRG